MLSDISLDVFCEEIVMRIKCNAFANLMQTSRHFYELARSFRWMDFDYCANSAKVQEIRGILKWRDHPPSFILQMAEVGNVAGLQIAMDDGFISNTESISIIAVVYRQSAVLEWIREIGGKFHANALYMYKKSASCKLNYLAAFVAK